MDSVLGLVIAAAIGGYVAYDAWMLRKRELEVLGTSNIRPILWGIGVLLLLIVFLPWYLVVRSAHKKDMMAICPTCLRLVNRGAATCPYCRTQLPVMPHATTALAMSDPAPAPACAPGWFSDPTGRHELRYWDGVRWTSHVSDSGAQSVDA